MKYDKIFKEVSFNSKSSWNQNLSSRLITSNGQDRTLPFPAHNQRHRISLLLGRKPTPNHSLRLLAQLIQQFHTPFALFNLCPRIPCNHQESLTPNL